MGDFKQEDACRSQLNALGMIVKIEGAIAEALLGESLQPKSLVSLGMGPRGLHVVFASSAKITTNPEGTDLAKRGDRIVAILDPIKEASACLENLTKCFELPGW